MKDEPRAETERGIPGAVVLRRIRALMLLVALAVLGCGHVGVDLEGGQNEPIDVDDESKDDSVRDGEGAADAGMTDDLAHA